MRIQVKICGITSVEAADAAVRAGADYAGLMFHPRSPRNLTLEAARELADRMRRRTRIVAVLCDASDDRIESVIAAARPEFLQLHGTETPDRVGFVHTRFGLPVIKAISVAEAGDFATVPGFEQAADMLLFDAKPPPGASREGGHGNAFDWQLIQGRRFARPWLLAGGLTPENVQRALQVSGAPGVDASSGVESALGIKNPDLVRAFIAAAHNAQFATEQGA